MAGQYLLSHGIDLTAEMEKIQFNTNDSSVIVSAPPPYSASMSLANPAKPSSISKPDSLENSVSSLDSLEDAVEPIPSVSSTPVQRIVGVRLPRRSPHKLYDVLISDGTIAEVVPHDANTPSIATLPGVLHGNGRLVAPSLCHPHIHLDKCFLLSDPAYADLEAQHGTFDEALALIHQAKTRFTRRDLLRRGRRLVFESLRAGVTAMRAFVEVDDTVGTRCLDAAVALRDEFRGRCDIQLCAFAQGPLFSGPDGGSAARRLLRAAAARSEVAVVGSAPDAETDVVKSRMNVRWLAGVAMAEGKALTFHLDHVGVGRPPLVHSVVSILQALAWADHDRSGRPVCLGHCTRLAHWSAEEWRGLKERIDAARLNISFVGLPTSDMFMMEDRSTLNPVQLVRDHQLNTTIAVNNVGNVFTPHGNCDPLSIANLGVSVYGAGTKSDASLLYNCIAARAKSAIGLDSLTSQGFHAGQPADFVLFGGDDWSAPRSLSDVVYHTNAVSDRLVVSGGQLLHFSRGGDIKV